MNWSQALVVGLAVGAAAGFGLGRWSSGIFSTPKSSYPPPAPEDFGPSSASFSSSLHQHSSIPRKDASQPPSKTNEIQPLSSSELIAALEKARNAPRSKGSPTFVVTSELRERVMVSEIPKLLDDLKAQCQLPAGQGSFFFVFSIFAEQDPKAAWDYALGLPAGPLREQALGAAVQELAAADPFAVLTLANSTQDINLRLRLRHTGLLQLADKDPRRAAELASQFPDEINLPVAFVYMKWAQKDPSAAWQAAARLPGQFGKQAQIAVLNTLAPQDPQKAWEYAHSAGSDELLANVVSLWAQTEASAALRAAESMAPGSPRNRAMQSALQSWAARDLRAAVEYAANYPEPVLRSDLLRAITYGSISDPAFLFETLVRAMPPGDNFHQAAEQTLQTWARQDPQAAAARIQKLPPGRLLTNAASQVAGIWSSAGQPLEALDWARRLPEGPARVQAMRSVLGALATQDSAQAIALAERLPENERPGALLQVGRIWSRQNPTEALRWATQIQDQPTRQEIMKEAVRHWAQDFPQEAATFAAQLPEKERADVLRAAIERWAARDAESAAQWLRQLPPSPSNDGARAGLARRIAAEDPETGLDWANALHDPQFRERTVEQLVREWLRQEPQAARSWISRAPLPEELRQKLLK